MHAKDPDYLALLDEVLDHPDDDTPRLLLADWHDDHGEPDRAEFIRAQVELDDLLPCHGWAKGEFAAGCPGCDEKVRLWRRERAAWNAPAKGFSPPLGGWVWTVGEADPGLAAPCGVVRRGFVEAVQLTTDLFKARALALFTGHPVTSVTLTDQHAYPASRDSRVAWFQPDVPGTKRQLLTVGLFEGLDGYDNRDAMPAYRVKWYDTRKLADAALSRSCVRVGRGLREASRRCRA